MSQRVRVFAICIGLIAVFGGIYFADWLRPHQAPCPRGGYGCGGFSYGLFGVGDLR